MGKTIDYKKEIMNLTEKLPEDKLGELIDFAQFLRAKNEGFTYTRLNDSAEYIRDLRIKEGKRFKSGKTFIKELLEW